MVGQLIDELRVEVLDDSFRHMHRQTGRTTDNHFKHYVPYRQADMR